MAKSKNKKLLIICILGLVLIFVGTTYAFFNYIKTGSVNTVAVGRISFNTSQSGTIALTNVFPIERTNAASDNINSNEVVITITGDTTYTNGIEYLVTAEDVNTKTSTNKKIPVGIILTPEKTGELGTSDSSYYTNRGGNSSIYKSFIENGDSVEDTEYLLVGYIASGQTGINGTIGIRAFIDKDNIVVSDTYDGSGSDYMGTSSDWVNGRTVLTTDEWNALQGNNAISFKVRVQANEGIWVPEPTTRNDIDNINSVFPADKKSAITEINFIRMSEEMINTHDNLIDLKDYNGTGMVKGWIDGTKLYIASPGETYFPEDSSFLFSGFTNLTNIYFNNINTSGVTDMAWMFDGLTKMNYIDVSKFDTSNVTTMQAMFRNCSSMIDIDISKFDTSNVTTTTSMFNGCTGLTSIDLHNFDFSKNDYASEMFYGCSNLQAIDLSRSKFSNISNLHSFIANSGIKYVNMSGNRIYNDLGGGFLSGSEVETIDMVNLDASGTSSIAGLFYHANKLSTINASGMKFGTSVGGFISSYGGLSSLERVDLRNADLSHTTTVGGMFSGVNSLKYVNLSGANFSGAVVVGGLFSGGTGLETIDLSNTNFSNVTSSSGMFSGVSGLKTINLSNANFRNTTSTSNMFSGSNNIETIDLSNANYSGLQNASAMFIGLTSLSILNLSGINMSNVTNMTNMFGNCTSLTTLDLSDFNTSNVIDMSSMFYNCTSLTSIDLSGLGGDDLTTISGIFNGCTSLKEINMSNFNFGEITDLSDNNSPFNNQNMRGLNVIETINLSGANMSNVTTIAGMFLLGDGYWATIKNIDMSNARLNNVQDVSNLFRSCRKLVYVDLSGINITADTSYMFGDCSGLTTVDLSGANITSTDTSYMFGDCSSLTKIYVNNTWNVSNVVNSYSMFYNCTSLVGGNGTTFDSTIVDKTYARVDTPSTPGYLTLKTS